MKETEFRVWNGSEYEYNIMTGKFGTFYVNPRNNGLDEKDSASLSPFTTKIENAIPEQYTGKKDKYDRKVFEGDIVPCHILINGKDRCFNSVIKWNDFLCGFVMFMPQIDDDQLMDCCVGPIIGNKHENPELLEGNIK